MGRREQTRKVGNDEKATAAAGVIIDLLRVRVEREIDKRETRLTFKGDSRMCEDVLRIVEKCLEYRSIEVKKQRKSKLKR